MSRLPLVAALLATVALLAGVPAAARTASLTPGVPTTLVVTTAGDDSSHGELAARMPTFAVRATDAAGNADPSAVTDTWSVT